MGTMVYGNECDSNDYNSNIHRGYNVNIGGGIKGMWYGNLILCIGTYSKTYR